MLDRITSILGAGAISWIRSQARVKVDAAMALTFSSFFAAGVLLISLLRNNVDLDSFLFGDILGVTMTDVYRTGISRLVISMLVGPAPTIARSMNSGSVANGSSMNIEHEYLALR